jgi:asparagine synthase (glutamine-hydrolysing)
VCGIVGIAGIAPSNTVMSAMIDRINHRGPDDLGYCQYEDLAIGMTRLAIVDIAGGAQPMHSEDGRFSIVFNGEIYNYLELANAYTSQEGILKTRSDTEVILALYQSMGERCLSRLRGMFTIAIIDRLDSSLFLARDRVGIKPLYIWQSGSALMFGSEIKSLLASGQFQAEANYSAISDYLSLRYVPGTATLFRNISKLAPGHWLKWRKGITEQNSYWHPTIRAKLNVSDAEVQENFNSFFDESIGLHLMGDVPHGAYLSGGLDSSCIVSALAQRETQVKTFTVGFGWKGDELSQARDTAKQLGCEHHEIICRSEDLALLPKIVWHSDEPLGDPIVVPTYRLAEEASRHVKVVLSGEGADEILAGYLFHRAVTLADKYRRYVPNILNQAVVEPLVRYLPINLLNIGFNYPGYLGASGKKRLLNFLSLSRNDDPAKLLRFFISLFNDSDQDSLFTGEWHHLCQQEQTKTNWENSSVGSVLDKTLLIQYSDWLPDNILLRQDKMSMAHGLEARLPYLDHELIEFMEIVPDHLKLGLRNNKVLLRKYASSRGLQPISRRKKNAFYFPMEEYFASPTFQALLSTTLNQDQVIKRGLFNFSAITTLIARMRQKDFLAAKQIFSLISLELWFQIFIDKQLKIE